MVYITGDMHGDIDRLYDKQLKKLKSGDTLIVCGDFGFIWDGNSQEAKILEELGSRKYNVCFVDGLAFFDDEVRCACLVDGCHPNDTGFVRMADSIGAVVRYALEKKLGL